MKKLLFGLLMAVVAQTSFAQTLEKITGASLIMVLLWMMPPSIMQRMAVNLKLK